MLFMLRCVWSMCERGVVNRVYVPLSHSARQADCVCERESVCLSLCVCVCAPGRAGLPPLCYSSGTKGGRQEITLSSSGS
jgi:hypothetical protein